jgi:hypothetical protein
MGAKEDIAGTATAAATPIANNFLSADIKIDYFYN